MPMDSWLARYLDLLGLTIPKPTLSGLHAIASVHTKRVPFENISSILRRQAHGPSDPVPPLDTDVILDAWTARRAGGVCFEVTTMVDRLLTELGYRTHPVLAQISFPGSHMANVVDLDGQRYLVDLGNGAPFVEPIVLDGERVVRHAGLAYRFRPAPDPDEWLQEREIDGVWQPFCRYLLREPDPEVRETAYQMHHTIGQSWVVDALVLVVCSADDVWALRDQNLRHFTADGKTVDQLSETADYAALAATQFGLPHLPINAARSALATRN